MPQGRKQQTSHPNVHKAPERSQPSITNMGALERNGPTRTCLAGRPRTARLTERCHKGANRKWATQMCTRHLGGHNLAKLIRVPSNETAQPERTRSGDLTRRDTTRSTERCHKGANDKRASRTCTRHTGGHNLAKLIRVPSKETTRPQRSRLGELTRDNMAHPTEQCHMGKNGKWASRTCTRHPSGHNLAKLIWAPSNEMIQPERVWSSDLTLRDTVRPIERCHKGENRKWVARMCTS